MPATTLPSTSPLPCSTPRELRRRWLAWILPFLLVMVGLASLLVGAMDLSNSQVLAIMMNRLGLSLGVAFSPVAEIVVWEIRLPRLLLAILVGGGLAMAGAAMQGVFRNPLADPGIIGVSGGGAMGALLTILALSRLALPPAWEWFGLYAVPVGAMTGALLMTLLIYRLSLAGGKVDLVSMLLVGIAVNALGGSLIGLLTFVSTDEELRTMTFWGLGSLGRANWELMLPALVFLLPPLFWIPRFATSLNALLLGEEDAAHLGISVKRVKNRLIVLSACLVGATVALCGAIGFIALVAPHMVRTFAGPDHRFLLPASAFLGALLLMLADLGSRTLVAPSELPIGILTALLGAPVFLFLLRQRRGRLEGGAGH